METEVRFYYSINSKDKILNYLSKYEELEYKGRFYEKTDQYNHPMKEYDYYSKEIDGRFRIRRTINDEISKCMITWKRRLNDVRSAMHKEEEVEITIKDEEYDNLIFLIENVLHLNIVESYERYRTIFSNDEVEIVIDEYPFGIAIEIENKSKNQDGEIVVKKWLKKLDFNINEAYKLSWDDKYNELCNEQKVAVHKIVTFDKKMPKVTEKFDL